MQEYFVRGAEPTNAKCRVQPDTSLPEQSRHNNNRRRRFSHHCYFDQSLQNAQNHHETVVNLRGKRNEQIEKRRDTQCKAEDTERTNGVGKIANRRNVLLIGRELRCEITSRYLGNQITPEERTIDDADDRWCPIELSELETRTRWSSGSFLLLGEEFYPDQFQCSIGQSFRFVVCHGHDTDAHVTSNAEGNEKSERTEKSRLISNGHRANRMK